MSTEIAVVPQRQRPIVAIAQEDFGPAQERMIRLAEARVEEHQARLTDLEESFAIAKKNKWGSAPIGRAKNEAAKMVAYYGNVLAALRAGYMVMPDLDCDVYAVRVRDVNQVPRDVTQDRWEPAIPLVTADVAIPAGSGEYVSDLPTGTRSRERVPNGTGGEMDLHHFYVLDLVKPEAPLLLARPALLNAAQAAMASKIFDEIGIVGPTRRNRRGDPLLVGRIINPKTKNRIAFYLAWWFNPEDL